MREPACTHQFENLTPAQVVRVIKTCSLAFLPVSPDNEWHGPHLPLGTDGLISEGVATALAQHFDAVVFHNLAIGIDALRDEQQKCDWGLPEQTEVMGMNFPGFPVKGEYHQPQAGTEMLGPRLDALRESGFRRTFLVCHHGGQGQIPMLEAIATHHTTDHFQVRLLFLNRHMTLKPENPEWASYLQNGGHAGMLETLQLMAFHPDLIHLDALPDGDLKVAETGILHSEAVIPARLNPRKAPPKLAKAWRENLLANLIQFISAPQCDP